MSESSAKAKRNELPEPAIQMLADYLLVKLDSPKVMELTLQANGKAALIHRPDNSKAMAYLTGYVVAAGPGLVNIHLADNKGKEDVRVPMDCKVGDRVIFQSNLFNPFLLHGEEYVLLRDQNILGIL